MGWIKRAANVWCLLISPKTNALFGLVSYPIYNPTKIDPLFNQPKFSTCRLNKRPTPHWLDLGIGQIYAKCWSFFLREKSSGAKTAHLHEMIPHINDKWDNRNTSFRSFRALTPKTENMETLKNLHETQGEDIHDFKTKTHKCVVRSKIFNSFGDFGHKETRGWPLKTAEGPMEKEAVHKNHMWVFRAYKGRHATQLYVVYNKPL